MPMTYALFDGHDIDELGFLPAFLNEEDPRPAGEQFNTNYVGGWNPFPGFTMEDNTLQYPGDPPLIPIGCTTLRDEVILFYPYAFVAIKQHDGSFEAARMD